MKITKMYGNPKINWQTLGEPPMPFVNHQKQGNPLQDPSQAYAYPYYNYYESWPKRCIQDPISLEIRCEDRNFIGPNYNNAYYTGPNFIDPVAQRGNGEARPLRKDAPVLPRAPMTRPNLTEMGHMW